MNMPHRRPFEHAITVLIVAAVIAGAFVLGRFTQSTPLTHIFYPSHYTVGGPEKIRPAPGDTYYILSAPQIFSELFHFSPVDSVVNSAYWYEGSLIGYQTPVADIDGITCYGCSNDVKLPGFVTDHYYLVGIVFVEGSGYVEEWQIANGVDAGARFSFLHMRQGPGFTTSAQAPIRYGLQLPPGMPGVTDDDTWLAVGTTVLTPSRAPGAGYYVGGESVGKSGWPTWPQYGNGSAGEQNAHLCLLVSQGAADWLYAIATGRHKYLPPKPKPTKPFNSRVWNEYRVSHHLKTIAYKDKHGKLTFAAKLWSTQPPPKIGGIVSPESWHPKGRKGVDGFEEDFFQSKNLLFWPRHPNWHIKWTSHTRIH